MWKSAGNSQRASCFATQQPAVATPDWPHHSRSHQVLESAKGLYLVRSCMPFLIVFSHEMTRFLEIPYNDTVQPEICHPSGKHSQFLLKSGLYTGINTCQRQYLKKSKSQTRLKPRSNAMHLVDSCQKCISLLHGVESRNGRHSLGGQSVSE